MDVLIVKDFGGSDLGSVDYGRVMGVISVSVDFKEVGGEKNRSRGGSVRSDEVYMEENTILVNYYQ